MTRVDCAIVIVTYNSARDIGQLLESIPAAAAGLTLRVVVVDNGSIDDTVEIVRGYPDLICIETGNNLGYSAGINIGRRCAGGYSALAILNPDLVLEAGSLHALCAALDDPGVGAVVPMLLDAQGERCHSLRREPTVSRAVGDALLGSYFARRPGWLSEMVYADEQYGYRHPVEWATGAAMIISAACDHAVGQWDEDFFLYSEEVDYAARIRAAGFRIDYFPVAQARHRGAGSGHSSALYALQVINRIRYTEKYRKNARIYRSIVLVHELIRSISPHHRTALLMAARRSSWPGLIASIRMSHPRKQSLCAVAQAVTRKES